MAETRTVKITEIVVNTSIQQRAGGIDEQYAAELAQVLASGTPFKDDPIVYQPKKGRYILAGGFHRHRAYVIRGIRQIQVEVRQGDYRDALRYAIGDNADHGRRRSREDIRKAATSALTDPEWCELSVPELAKLVNCDAGWLYRLKRNLTGAEPDKQKSDAAKKGNEQRNAGKSSGKACDTKGDKPAKEPADESTPTGVYDERGFEIPDSILEAYQAGDGYAVCPMAFGLLHDDDCETCGGKSYLTREEYESLDHVQAEASVGPIDPVERALAFRGEFEAAEKLARQLSNVLDRLASNAGGWYLRNTVAPNGDPYLMPVVRTGKADRYTFRPLLDLIRLLKAAKPKCRCTAIADPDATHGDCQHCCRQGWAPESQPKGMKPGSVQLEFGNEDPWGDE